MSAPSAKKAVVDHDRIDAEYQRIFAGKPWHGVELDIVNLFRESASAGHFEERIPMTENDSVVYEMALRFGRADIVVFHSDGSASVIEVKDGSNGYNHVVSGIGQAGLYAVQLAMSKGALKSVRKCLLWTSTGSLALDCLIEEVCEQASVIPLPWQSMDSLMAMREAVTLVVGGGEIHGRA